MFFHNKATSFNVTIMSKRMLRLLNINVSRIICGFSAFPKRMIFTRYIRAFLAKPELITFFKWTNRLMTFFKSCYWFVSSFKFCFKRNMLTLLKAKFFIILMSFQNGFTHSLFSFFCSFINSSRHFIIHIKRVAFRSLTEKRLYSSNLTYYPFEQKNIALC